jgi:hypothetical protein
MEGVPIEQADRVIVAEEMIRFEDEHSIYRRKSASRPRPARQPHCSRKPAEPGCRDIVDRVPVLALARLAAIAVMVPILLWEPVRELPPRPILALLVLMGGLDALALGAVLVAGGLAHAEFAAVAASVFGIVTVLIAWAVLREPITAPQWGGVLLAFAAIGYLAAS